MTILAVLGGWFVLSVVLAVFIGKVFARSAEIDKRPGGGSIAPGHGHRR
jgi:hypothetical protein